jgi:hypothetical protein
MHFLIDIEFTTKLGQFKLKKFLDLFMTSSFKLFQKLFKFNFYKL